MIQCFRCTLIAEHSKRGEKMTWYIPSPGKGDSGERELEERVGVRVWGFGRRWWGPGPSRGAGAGRGGGGAGSAAVYCSLNGARRTPHA